MLAYPEYMQLNNKSADHARLQSYAICHINFVNVKCSETAALIGARNPIRAAFRNLVNEIHAKLPIRHTPHDPHRRHPFDSGTDSSRPAYRRACRLCSAASPCIVLAFYNGIAGIVKQANDIVPQIVNVGLDNAAAADSTVQSGCSAF